MASYGSLMGTSRPPPSKVDPHPAVAPMSPSSTRRHSGLQPGEGGPETVVESIRAFYSHRSSGRDARLRLVVALPCVLAVALCYTIWYGNFLGLGLLNSLYFFAITVTTIGYSSPDEASDGSSEDFYLILYMWLSVLCAGVALAVIIAAVHEAAENTYVRLLLQEADGDGAALEKTLHHDVAARATGESRIVRAARTKADFFRSRLGHQVFQIFVVFFIGTVAIMAMEDWSYVRACLWSTETMTSIGYGNDEASTSAGKVFTVFYAVTATLVFARVVGLLSSYPRQELGITYVTEALEAFGFGERSDVDAAKVAAIFPADAPGAALSRHEFALRFLLTLGKIDADDVGDACELFDRLSNAAPRTGVLGGVFGAADPEAPQDGAALSAAAAAQACAAINKKNSSLLV